MKKIVCVLLMLMMLCGCAQQQKELDRGIALRSQWLTKTISFDAQITADYGNVSYTFSMACEADPSGNLSFTVTKPETLSGISGNLSENGGKLTFDGAALGFELMADDQITPVSAPWVLVKSLRSGYLSSVCNEGELLRLSIDDSYEEDALHLEIWLNRDDQVQNAEIYWQGRRLLTLSVSNFQIR